MEKSILRLNVCETLLAAYYAKLTFLPASQLACFSSFCQMQCAKPKAITKSSETNENWAKEWAWVQSWLANNCNLLSQAKSSQSEPGQSRARDAPQDEGEQNTLANNVRVRCVQCVGAVFKHN